MKDIKGVNVNRDIRYVYIQDTNNKDSFGASDLSTNNFGCQFNSKKDNLVCTCKKIKRGELGYFASRQVFRSQRFFDTNDFPELRVGGVKTVYRRRVKKIYLPETEDKGVGSSDLSYLRSRKRWIGNYYEIKKTSSKCVGGVMEEIKASVISKKLSPIIQTISISTSPTNINIDKNDNTSSFENRRDIQYQEKKNFSIPEAPTLILKSNNNTNVPLSKDNKITSTTTIDDSKNFSSDSFEQHVHNLENPSNDKQSKTSLAIIENKLEREYRKIFSTSSKTPEKPVTDRKSSLLKRRFMALTRLGKKEDKNNSNIMKISSKSSVTSKRDVSIASDPPSLEARSYSNTKIYSSSQSDVNTYKKDTTKNKITHKWSTEIVDSDCRDVKDMFKLWGKKFNLEESYKESSPENLTTISKKQKKKVELVLPKKEELQKEKKEGKRFSFFRRKSKDKSKPFKSKKGITAGRCEVGDGLMIKIGAPTEYNMNESTKRFEGVPEYDVLRKAWFRRYLHDRIDSQNSVQIRWNNNMYGTSSSTVFELIDCIYKNTGFVFKSRSLVTTRDSSHYSYRNPQVNFLQQSVQAWMIPTVTGDQPQSTSNKKSIEVTISNQRWFVDKSKAFSQKIELVLNTDVQNKAMSSEYIVIDIPDGYFSESSDDKRDQTSDEVVYNVIEYDIPNLKSFTQNRGQWRKLENGVIKDTRVPVKYDNTIATNVFEKPMKGPCFQRDVVIQGSDVCFPRRCDVIGVGIITQRDLRKPILKINNEPTEIESKLLLPPPRTSELAESFLQDYYKNCSPLGFDIFSWCVSDSKLHGSSASNSIKSFNNQGDGSKSCPNMYEDYLAHSTIVSSCDTSSCSHCVAVEQDRKEDKKTLKFFDRFKKAGESNTNRKRVLPKDSLEVFKRRKYYAQINNKSKWFNSDPKKLCNVSSFQETCAQQPLGDCPKVDESNKESHPKSGKCKKHVSLQDCDILHEQLKEQLSDKTVEGILSFKGAGGCDDCKNISNPRRARVIPDPLCVIPKPPCEESCLSEKKPACSKKNSPTCNVPKPPPCPVDPNTPCQKACPPTPPPCRTPPPCKKTSSLSLTKPPKKPTCSKSASPRSSSSNVKVIPPRIRSPPISPNPSRPCACPKKVSISSIPHCKICKSPLQSTAPSTPIPRHLFNCQSCNSPCNSPPSKVKQVCSQEFPWPLKSQVSNTPSKESGISLKISSKQNLLKKTSSKCMSAIKQLIKKCSGSSLKDCRPDCANRRKLEDCPPAPPPTANISAKANKCPKITGLHLKKAPMPKTGSKDCLPGVDDGVIRLNSREEMTVKLRQGSPSTDEIREGLNIKVQDEDGQTLYERKDYRRTDKGRMQLVKDMYRESQIQRLVTTNPDILQKETDLKTDSDSISDMNLSNIIEINFNLKFNQEDNTTETDIQNYDKIATDEKEQQIFTHHEDSKEVFILNDQQKQQQSNEINKNTDRKGVHINIIIKNYKVSDKQTNKCNENMLTEEFSKKISEKFQSVSTGYSDVIDHPTFSIHRATIDLSDCEITKPSNKSSLELHSNKLKETQSSKISESEKTDNLTVSNKTSSNFDDILITKTESHIKLSKDDIYTTNDEKSITSFSVTGKDTQSEVKDVDKSIVHKIRDKEEKKRMLKEIFESPSNDKLKNKERLRQMLHAVLTSDSSDFDIDINNLAKNPTYESLKDIYFKNSSSITNYLNNTLSAQSVSKEFKKIYTTEDDNSDISSSAKLENSGCLCNKMAQKLKINDNIRACCCGKINKTDIEVNCDLNEDSITINKVDVQTQNYDSNSQKIISYYENVEKIKETKSRQYSTNVNVKACQIKKISKRTILSLSDDDQIVLLSSKKFRTSKKVGPIDILQLHETKKAVLGIYAEKRQTKDGAKIVSKLPKFMYERESDIRNYQEVMAGYKR